MNTTDELDVPCLRDLWERAALRRSGQTPRIGRDSFALDSFVLHQLGLPLEPAFAFLASGPTFEAFGQWVLDTLGHPLEAEATARATAVVAGVPYDADTQARLDALEAAPAVLSADDLGHWDEHGYVVVHDAITPAEVSDAERVVWEYLGMDSEDPRSWYGASRSHGIMVQFFCHRALGVVRTSPRVHKAFAQLSGTADLYATVDRCSFNPPETRDWKFPGPHLHWDVEFEAPIPLRTQGLLYLTDTSAEQGAFSCIPGFHRRIDVWLQSADERARQNPSDLDPSGGTPVPGRAGDLVIWHWALPHGSRPNRASRPRIVQYVNMHPPPGRSAPGR